jgi:hypothetical protein
MELPSLTLVASGLLVAAFALVVAAGLDLTRLRVATPVLRGPADLARFRRAIARQRWATLGVLALFIGAGVAILLGLLGGWCRPDDLPLTFAAGVPLLVVEWWLRYVEARFKAVPAADPRIRLKWERALQEWEEHPVPDW